MGNYLALSELKSALQITGGSEDDFLNLAIDSSEKAIDNLCGRYFTQDGATSARVYRAQPYYAVVGDISTDTGLVGKTDTSGDGSYDTTWTATDYQLEPLNNLGKSIPARYIRAVGSNTFPVYGDGQAAVEVTAKWGWASVPTPVKQATLMLSSRMYGRKASPMGVIGVGDFGPVRISRSDPDVAALLEEYRLAAVA